MKNFTVTGRHFVKDRFAPAGVKEVILFDARDDAALGEILSDYPELGDGCSALEWGVTDVADTRKGWYNKNQRSV